MWSRPTTRCVTRRWPAKSPPTSDPIASIAADGPAAVTVTMATDADPSPYLLLGIVPSEKVQPDPVANWTLNKAPVGTGPYVLKSLDPDQAVLEARDDYWGEKPHTGRLHLHPRRQHPRPARRRR